METVRTIKGFDNELKCRGFQYEIGKTYTAEGIIEVCSNGFHAIRNDVNPLSVFEYYAPVQSGKPSRYCIVECSGEIEYDDNKLCCSTITIVEEITLDKLHELSQAWVESHRSALRGGYFSALRGGNFSALRGGDFSALRGGDYSALRGGYGSALRGGDYSALRGGYFSALRGGDFSALRGGDYSALRGGYGSALRGGDYSALRGGDFSALRGGNCSKFCGGKWSTFYMEIRGEYGEITGIATAIVDDVNIKANQWYEFDADKGEWTECDAG